MRFLLIAFLLSFALTAKAQQDTLKSFWGIPFGSTKEEVKSLKPNAKLTWAEHSYFCDECTFGAFKGLIFLSFNAENKLAMCGVSINPTKDELIFELYDEAVKSIESKYGKPDFRKEEFQALYEGDRGRKFPTLSVPTSYVVTSWTLVSMADPKKTARILVKIDREFQVRISYFDYALAQSILDKNKSNASNDY